MTTDQTIQKSKESYDRKNPYPARFISCNVLNKTGSTKEALHVVLDLKQSGITYKPGSSFGIYPENNPNTLCEILSLLGRDPLTPIFDKRNNDTLPLHLLLRDSVNLSRVTSQHLQLIHKYAPNDVLEAILKDKPKLTTFLANNNFRSFLSSFWHKNVPIDALCDILPPLLPRLYSIASSQHEVGDEVHFLIASFSYMQAGRLTHSVTAQYLKNHCEENQSTVRLFLQENKNFVLPEDNNTPIIMIGPGTGIAAFRGFIQERKALHAPGKNWLFTGDRERSYDFYYEEELLSLKEQGLLRLSLAFSRDGPNKIYVQDKMLEEAKDLWHWIKKENATIYISGDAKHMAKDVQKTLLTIAMEQGSLIENDALKFFKELRLNKKLLLDVY